MLKQGNSCLYFLQQFFNVFLILSGALIVTLGIYLWTVTKIFNFVEIVFMALGGLQIVIGFLGIYIQTLQKALSSKRSVLVINTYIFILALIFIFQLTATILGFYFKDELVDKAVAVQESSQEAADALRAIIDNHVTIAMYTTIACLGIQFMCLVFSICYKDSIQNNNSTYHLMYNSKEGRLMSLEETQNLQRDKAQVSTDQKRQEIYSKNPEYYEWKMKQEKEEKTQKGLNNK